MNVTIENMTKERIVDYAELYKRAESLYYDTEDLGLTVRGILDTLEDDPERAAQVEERLDMILLHCPPTPVYQRDDIFGELERQKKAGNIASYGVSIEKVSEGARREVAKTWKEIVPQVQERYAEIIEKYNFKHRKEL